MKMLKQEVYFPIIIGIHFIFWAIDLSLYNGSFMEVSSDTLFFGELTNVGWDNAHRILGEVFSSWVVTVFAFNFLMATRARWVEKLFGGLDKMYLIHRRSGVIAVFLLLAHFIAVPRDLVAFNPGKPLGFYALILIIVGVILSAAPIFKRKIPYNKWINFHKLMGLFYVMAVLHGLMVSSLIKELPITRVYVFGMAFLGIAAWFYRAFLYGVFNKKLNYSINEVNDLGSGITEVKLKAKANELVYKAGQFVFVKFPSISKKEQHPFTISSHPSEGDLRVTIKGLGDYTNNLHEKIAVGEAVTIEGPFGLFTFDNLDKKEQIWIAGGIGITPFLSLIKEVGNQKNVKLFWCVKNDSEAIYKSEIEAVVAENPNIDFTVWTSDDNGYLTVDKLGLTAYKDKDYLICGPQVLKTSIMTQLKKEGVKQKQIHDEEFAFR
ncbi:MAG: hypothetical protein GQ574_29320 [Crocinitomix sp.]|nr:hypothetical protein [Crocinitomix sp.]